MINVRRVNHVVLYVKDLFAMTSFYERILGLVVVERFADDARFLAVRGTDNHHDLGLVRLASDEDVPHPPRIGLYHIAWQVETPQDLTEARRRLADEGVLRGESEHGTSLSLYAQDPEGNEFEIFWLVPKNRWGERPFGVRPLALDEELRRFGAGGDISGASVTESALRGGTRRRCR